MAKRKVIEVPSEGSDDESIRSSEGMSGSEYSLSEDESSSGSDDTGGFRGEEQQAEKRLKLAKEYLTKLGDEAKMPGDDALDSDGDEIDAAACDREYLAGRLRQDALQAKGKRFEAIADQFSLDASGYEVKELRGHSQTPTCAAVTRDGKFAFTGSKAGDIIKWDLDTGKKVYRFAPGIRQNTVKKAGGMMPKGVKAVGHTGHVLCIAVSFDGKFVASGGLDKTINIWDGQKHCHLAAFTQHRGAVTGLAFQYGTYQLYSCSTDRTVKIWGLEQLAYIDTLFGHQDAVLGIHTLAQERCLTVGSRDRTARLWKIPEESQLIFRASEDAGGSQECAQLLTEDYFVTGSDQGALAIWSVGKKKPFRTLRSAHENIYAEETGDANGILSMSAVPFTDLFATGSTDGMLRVWKAEKNFTGISSLGQIPVEGALNGLAFSDDGRVLVAAVGRDQRLGRWSVDKAVKNRVVVVRFTH